jgi:hypothetical protein
MSTALYSHVYFDTYDKQYRNIITINAMPTGPLATLVTRVKFSKISAFHDEPACGLAIKSIRNYNKLMLLDELDELISFLFSNGYTVDTSLSSLMLKNNMTNRLIAFIKN